MGRAEVLGRVKRHELSQVEAAEILRVSYRQAKRLWRRYREGGAKALRHGNVGRRSGRARPEEERRRVLAVVRERYGGGPGKRLGPTLAAEELAREYGLRVDAETLRRWMLAGGLWGRQRRRRAQRRRRERRAHFGELVQMDGSFHAWLEERGPVGCLLHMVDDARGVAEGQIEPQETIWAAADGLRAWVEKYGVPRALYVDHKNVYVRAPNASERVSGAAPLTAFGRMCAKLGTEIIAAGSPQAKGRIERANGVQQDRLVKKLRLRGIADYEAANRYLREQYWGEHNRRFAVEAAQAADYHRPVPKGMNLDEVFSLEEERKLAQDWVVHYRGRLLQVQGGHRGPQPGQTVLVRELRDGTVQLLWRGRKLAWEEITARPQRQGRAVPAVAKERIPVRRQKPPSREHPWRQAAERAWRQRRESSGGNGVAVEVEEATQRLPQLPQPLGNPAEQRRIPTFPPLATAAGLSHKQGDTLNEVGRGTF